MSRQNSMLSTTLHPGWFLWYMGCTFTIPHLFFPTRWGWDKIYISKKKHPEFKTEDHPRKSNLIKKWIFITFATRLRLWTAPKLSLKFLQIFRMFKLTGVYRHKSRMTVNYNNFVTSNFIDNWNVIGLLKYSNFLLIICSIN